MDDKACNCLFINNYSNTYRKKHLKKVTLSSIFKFKKIICGAMNHVMFPDHFLNH